MEKYIYYSGGFIREISEFGENHIFVGDNNGGGTAYPKNEFDGILKKAKLFNDFEDLIEVGDLVKLYNRSNGRFHQYLLTEVGKIDKDSGWYYSMGIRFAPEEAYEIWKRINNTFIRVCHKENGSWVID